MKKKVIIEETVKIQHAIIIEGDEEDIESALDCVDYADNKDEYISQLAEYVNIIKIDEQIYIDSDGVEYINEEDVEEEYNEN